VGGVEGEGGGRMGERGGGQTMSVGDHRDRYVVHIGKSVTSFQIPFARVMFGRISYLQWLVLT